MTRITCQQIASAKPIAIRGIDAPVAVQVIAEANDFEIPDPDNGGALVVRAGEIWFGSPLYLYNRNAATCTVTVTVLTEAGVVVTLGKVEVPSEETIAFAIQGQSLLKRNAGGSQGDQLRIQASHADSIAWSLAGYERAAEDHIGVTP